MEGGEDGLTEGSPEGFAGGADLEGGGDRSTEGSSEGFVGGRADLEGGGDGSSEGGTDLEGGTDGSSEGGIGLEGRGDGSSEEWGVGITETVGDSDWLGEGNGLGGPDGLVPVGSQRGVPRGQSGVPYVAAEQQGSGEGLRNRSGFVLFSGGGGYGEGLGKGNWVVEGQGSAPQFPGCP